MTQTTAGEIEFVNEAPPISDGGAHHEVNFVNDWSELEEAVNLLNSRLPDGSGENTLVSYDVEQAVRVIVEFVPRLLTQYANLVELSFALTEGWEQYATLQAPTGLYLP